ncbi:MAG TPA: hypothetical protein VF702_00545 [Allosphingosinicella sp.]|jgi:hypothetical protein
MFRRFMMNRYSGRSAMGYRRRGFVASYGTVVLLVSLAVLLALYLAGYIAL